jgi:ADP-glucose pyrophosphorylase
VQANIDIAAHMGSPADRAVHEQAHVSTMAHVVDSVIGAGVSVGDHSTVLHSVILEGARIGSDAHVERSIVQGVVGNGARIEDCIVAPNGTVEAGLRSVGGRFPEIEQA